MKLGEWFQMDDDIIAVVALIVSVCLLIGALVPRCAADSHELSKIKAMNTTLIKHEVEIKGGRGELCITTSQPVCVD